MRFGPYVILFALSACAAATESPRRQHIAESVEATVLVVTEREGGGRRAGSGVVILGSRIGESVLIATTAHLLTPLTEQTVMVTVPHTGTVATADIVAVDEKTDLALLAVPLTDLSPVSMSETAQLGDGVWVVGFPWGKGGTLVNGAVSQIALSADSAGIAIDGAVRMIDAPVNYGTSGGGVFDARTGGLVGIVRGYRTVQMSLPGNTDGATLTLPVAGETTVIPTEEIICFLRKNTPRRQLTIDKKLSDRCRAS